MRLLCRYMSIALALCTSVICSYLPETDEFRLDNGARVVLSPNYDVRYANISILLNHGLIDQPTNMIPIFTQSILLKYLTIPKTDRKTADILDDYRSMAVSGHDFRVDVGLTRSAISIDVLPEDIGNMIYITKEILAERKHKKDPPVILQRMFNFMLWPIVGNAFNNLFYNPEETSNMHLRTMLYGTPLIKWDPNTVNDNEMLKEWGRSMLGPENMTVMVAGNINLTHTRLLIEKFFGAIDPADYIASDMPTYLPLEGVGLRYIEASRFLTDRGEKKVWIALGCPAPTYGSEDYYPYIIGYNYLFDEPSGMIYDRIKDCNVLSDLQASSNYNNDQRLPITNFWLGPETAAADSVYALVFNENNDLVENGLSANDLDMAKRIVVETAQLRYSNPQSFSIGVLGNINTATVAESMSDEIERLKSVTLDDLNRVLRKYFDLRNFSVVVMGDPKNEFKFLENYDNIDYVDIYGVPIEIENIE